MTHSRVSKQPRNLHQSGLTLLDLLMVIALIAIVGAIAIPDWTTEVEQADGMSAVAKGQTAIRALTFYALAGQGAALRVDTRQGSGAVMIVSANSGAQWSATMPSGWTLLVNGAPIHCVSLNSMGQPTANTTSPVCNFLPAILTQPLHWSVHDDGQSIPLS